MRSREREECIGFKNYKGMSSILKCCRLLVVFALAGFCLSVQGEISVPANTAYIEPLSGPAHVSNRQNGILNWTDPAQKILWFGEFKTNGNLRCAVEVNLPAGEQSKLRLSVGGKSRTVVAGGNSGGTEKVDFGSFEIAVAGYQKITLENLNAAGKSARRVVALLLDGAAAKNAHFNLKSRRNTASVHLFYPIAGLTNIDAFYCEVTAEQSPVWTYFMACGWHRGYFGMQVNSPAERRIIFSVWDSGSEPTDRNKVAASDRVTLVAKGKGVYAGDFGNEGTGGHSHLVYNWKTGEKQRFLVTEKVVDATHSIYSGYWFRPDQKRWMLISSWKAPKDGKYMHGLYSFVEDFVGRDGQLCRKARYGNQWVHTTDGRWHEETTTSFSADPTGRTERFDRFMGIEDGCFFLSTGGFTPGYTKYGTRFTRPATGKVPSDVASLLKRQ